MIDEEELQEFAKNMIKAYKNTSILREISQVFDYTSDIRNEFFQLGERILLQKKFFDIGNKYSNSVLAGDFVRAVVWGEENFIINHLIDSAKNKKLPYTKLKTFSYSTVIQNIMENVYAPTDIFIPIKPYFKEVHDWVSDGYGDYKDGLHINIANNRVKVHWSTNYTPFDKIIALDKTGIGIIQKKFEDMKVPKELGVILYKYGEGEYIRLDFAESEEPDKFDFFFRSVIAITNVDKNSVDVIQLNLEKL